MQLMTWNIQWGRGTDGQVNIDRIVTDAKQFSDFDVLCLQEVSAGFSALPGNDGSDQFRALGAQLSDYIAVNGVATDIPHPAGERRCFGNMILSRYPVLQVFRHLLPWPAEAGVKSMQRIALEATLETPIGPVRIITTHLEYYSQQQRQAQIARLKELQREAVAHARLQTVATPANGPFSCPPRGMPAILAGDCNFLPDSIDRRLIMAPIDANTPPYRDAWELAYPGLPHAATVGVHDKLQWAGEPFTFDFIFVSEDLAPRVRKMQVDADTEASDHQPVLLTLALN